MHTHTHINKMVLKKYLILILLFAFSQKNYAQKNETVLATVTYKISQVRNQQTLINDVCLMDISKNYSFFYSKNVAENIAKMKEAFEKASATGVKPNFNAADFVITKIYRFYKLHSFSKKETINIQSVGNQMLGYVDAGYTNNWEIKPDTMSINGLKCQKAILERSSSIITGWFCKDIPFQAGPFSFFGLPGLIVKTSSSDGWESELTGITYNKDDKKKMDIIDYALVSETDFKKAVENAKASRQIGGASPNTGRKQN
ncbi:GLPGLI family protein [Pedobacter montanisoli]|uniref:GLPGLI family protein n=1 Tax=Pedobacter montanisoli TaxID=2923277 RepID=A0ABS9ZX23_9SPHI|nr:GLPGLI family protein [Pedobacter montanisoli]MCJ0742845.1 GLPGLI family protein [Pedobacter montanisoli]